MSKIKKNTQKAFFSLLEAGLWEKDCRLEACTPIDFHALRQLAEEQSVVGLIAAGLEHVTDIKVQKKIALQFIGQTLQVEQRNQAMNYFISIMVEKMREAGVHSVLVKGQGIAQCYERPYWRSSGDIDLLLDAENYEKAKAFLTPLAVTVDEEDIKTKHLGMTIDPWVVELHGMLHCTISKKTDSLIDMIQENTLSEAGFRVWNNEGTDVLLPSPDNDVVFVFTHILKHFFRGGIGVRQICDWCRLLWTYRKEIDVQLLKQRVSEMGLLSEWKAFGVFAVQYLGMPLEAMPIYSSDSQWRRKAHRICSFVLDVGNFGHNRDDSFYDKYPRIVYKAISLGRHFGDLFRHLMIFPLDSIRVFGRTIFVGIDAVVKGK